VTYNDKKKLFKHIGGIIYNCVDNNGYTYLADELRNSLRDFQVHIAYSLVGY